jgi:hypothetical protein
VTESLFDALCERWLDPENDDPSEWTDERLMKHIEDLVGEGWWHAGQATQRLGDLAVAVEKVAHDLSDESKRALREAVDKALGRV